MADIKLVGAVAIKVRPDARGFKTALQKQIREELKGLDEKAKIQVTADTSQVKKNVAKAVDEAADNSITLRVGLDHDALRAAQKTLDKAVAALQLDDLKVTLDDKGIIEAQGKILELQEMAQVNMTMTSDEKGFQAVLDKINQVRRQKLELPIEFGTSDEELDAKEAEIRSMMQHRFETDPMTIHYTNDRESIQAALDQVNAELAEIDAVQFDVTANPESLETARDLIQATLDKTPVEMKIARDEKGFKEVLDKIAEIRRQKLEKSIFFKLDDASLDKMEADMKAALQKFSKTEEIAAVSTVTVHYQNNRASILAAMKQIRAELDKIKGLDIVANVDENDLEEKLRFLENKLAGQPVELQVNYSDQGSLKATRDKLTAMLNEVQAKTLEVGFNEEDLRAKLKDINSMIKEEVTEKHDVKLPVEPTGLELVARQLQFASRARRVPFHVVVDQKSLAIAEGVLRSLSGVNTLQSVTRSLEGIITNFDNFTLKSAAWTAGIGGLLDSFLSLGIAAFNVGGGMAQVLGLAALGPTAFGALATSMIIFQGVFKDFGAAVNGDSKAIEKLTESGKKAAAQIRVSFQEIRETISKNFWGAAGDAMLRFTETALPAFSRGLADTSGKLGKIFGGILDSFSNLSIAGGLDKMFANLVLMFDNSSRGATSLWDALNLLGLRGSDFLPRFGTFLSDISGRFKTFIEDSDKAGKINRWIEDGVTALKDMYHAGGAIIDQFRAITRAVGDAGGGGLGEFRDNMRSIADLMLGEPFRSRMATIFAGARRGANELSIGVQDFGNNIGAAAGYISELLVLSGRLGGGFFTNVGKTLGQFDFQTGTLEGLRDIQVALRDLGPSFQRVGDTIGDLSRIAGEGLRAISPVINTLSRMLEGITSKFSENLQKLAPTLGDLLNATLELVNGPLGALTDLLNAALTLFNGLPGPVKLAVGALLGMLALRNQFGHFAESMSKTWDSITTAPIPKTATLVSGVTGNFVKMADGSLREVKRMKDGTDRMFNSIGQPLRSGLAANLAAINELPRQFNGDPMIRELDRIGDRADGVFRRMGRSLLAFAGGPWGVALAAISAVIISIGDAAAKKKQNLDDFVTALDGQTGITTAARNLIATNLRTKESFLWMEGSSVTEAADRIGIALKDIQAAAEGVPGAMDKVDAALKRAFDSRSGFQEIADTAGLMTEALKGTGSAAAPLSALSGALNFFGGSDAARIAQGIKDQAAAMAAARREIELTARQIGVPVNASAGILAALDTLSEVASTAEQRIRAIKDILRALSGDRVGSGDAIQAQNDSLREFDKNFASIIQTAADEGVGLVDFWDDATKEIKTTTGAGSQLRTEYRRVAQAGIDSALKQAEAQLDPIKKQEVYRREIEKTRAKLAEPFRGILSDTQIEEMLKSIDLEIKPVEVLLSVNETNKASILEQLRAMRPEAVAALGIILVPLDSDSALFDVGIAEAEARLKGFSTQDHKAKLDADPLPFNLTLQGVVAQGAAWALTTWKSILDGDKGPFLQRVAEVMQTGFNLALMVFSPQLSAIKTGWDNAVTAVRVAGAMLNLLRFLPTIDAIGNALDVVRAIWATIQNFAGKVFSATLNIVRNFLGGGDDGPTHPNQPTFPGTEGRENAYGSILNGRGRGLHGFNGRAHYFANGGFYENHVAQIARPGIVPRVWAERETGGEAYLPLAASKRPRSVAILKQVANMFGYQISRAQEFANGGTTSSPVTNRSTSATVHIGTLNTNDPDGAVRKLRQSQRDALAVNGIF